MLETGRVGRVTSNGNVYVLFPHDCNTFRNAVSAVAVYFCTKSLGIGLAGYFLNLVGVRIILGLNEGKSVDTGNNLSSVLAQTV